MALSGDWATPKLNGLDYVEKPPLWYWMCAASYKVFGVNEAAAHLPLALLAVLALLGTAWLGSWLYNPAVGLTSAVILGTGGLFIFLSRYITPDLPLTVFLLWSSGMALRALLRPEDGAWAAPAAWAFAGLAFLSKGLVGLVFPAGCVLLCVLFPDPWGVQELLHPAGPALFLAIGALVHPYGAPPPWIPALLLHRAAFQRLTQKYNRSSPWYFFLVVAPAGLLDARRRCRAAQGRELAGPRRPRPAPALWSAMVLLFFSNPSRAGQPSCRSSSLGDPQRPRVGARLGPLPEARRSAPCCWRRRRRRLAGFALALGRLLPPGLVALPLRSCARRRTWTQRWSRRGRDVLALGRLD